MNVEIRRMDTAAEKAAGAQFEEAAGRLPGGRWVRELREAAIDRFARTGLPHRRIEEWKYTDLRASLRSLAVPRIAAGGGAEPATLAGVAAYRIVIADGEVRIAADLAAHPQVRVESLAEALGRDDAAVRALLSEWPDGAESPVLDLNAAFMSAGVLIDVADGAKLDRPIHLAIVTEAGDEAATYLRNAVVVGAGAEVTFVESYEGPDGVAYQVNTATRAIVGDGAVFTWLKVQREGDAAVHLATFGAEVGAGARAVVAPFTTGAALSRNNVAVRLDGAETDLKVAGVHLLAGRQHGDTTLFVDHKEPSCPSRELFKAVLDGRARGVFQGKILVRPEAQKTDGKMMSQALMLSETAEADNKPELEIYADDVQCGHGATCGRLDEGLLFYLRSRGIPRPQAEALLIESFVGEALDAISADEVREALTVYAHKWVAARREGA